MDDSVPTPPDAPADEFSVEELRARKQFLASANSGGAQPHAQVDEAEDDESRHWERVWDGENLQFYWRHLVTGETRADDF